MVFWKLNIPMFSTLLLITITALSGALAQQCGSQAGGAICPGRLCCNHLGQCGGTSDFCQRPNCQSQCWSGQCGSQAGGAPCPGRMWPLPPIRPPPLASPPPPPTSPPPPPASPPPPPASPPPPPASPPPPPTSPPPPPASPPPPPASPPPPRASPPPPPASPPPPPASPPPPPASPPPPPASPPPPRASPPPPPASPQCGSQAGGALCPGHLCCNQLGQCGDTSDFCQLPNCQSQCWSGQCGSQAGGALCPPGLCCSLWGWCGTTSDYCALPGCQSQCWASPSPPLPDASPPPPPSNISDIITRQLFQEMLPARNPFYTYDAFLTAASFFPEFGTTGDTATRKREIAAFFGQTSHETARRGDSLIAGNNPYFFGYYRTTESLPISNYCWPNVQYPCVPGQSYFGRGPIQITTNYNYGLAGEAIGENLLSNADLVATNAVVSFKTAIWFWMTEQLPKPSCHDVIIGNWTPSTADVGAGRLPGYGVITNIINRRSECGRGPDSRVDDRIGFFKRYCDIFGIEYGENLDCASQRPFGFNLLVDSM